jgi:hypothetical protein
MLEVSDSDLMAQTGFEFGWGRDERLWSKKQVSTINETVQRAKDMVNSHAVWVVAQPAGGA